MKVLILRFSSIGDIVLTTPVIRCLRKKYPSAQIHYASKKAFFSILQHNPYIDKIHLLNDSVFDLIKELRAEQFDWIIDLHHNQRTLLIKQMLGVKSRSFNKLNVQKWLMVHYRINALPKKHIVDRYFDACNVIDVPNDGEGLDYFLGSGEEVDKSSLPIPSDEPYLAWVIGGTYQTKKLPAAKVARILSALNYHVILLGGKNDLAEGDYIVQNTRNKTLLNACGKYSLAQSASIVRQAGLVLSNDTGLMHIAAAYKKPLISFWGNTIPGFGMYPYYGKYPVANTLFEIEKLQCRPCSKLGYQECPLGHFNCMNLLDELNIIDTINKYMSTVASGI